MEDSGLTFDEAYEQKADINTLIKSLDRTINMIVSSCFTKFSGAIDKEDIAQEVRIHLWEDVFNSDKNYFENMDAIEAHKYLATTIRLWAGRTILRAKRDTAPTVYEKDDISIPLFVTLSLFNIEYTNFPDQIGIENYIQRLRENCSDIINGETVLNYIAPKNNEDPEYSVSEAASKNPYAGLSSRTFYNAVNRLKKRAKKLL